MTDIKSRLRRVRFACSSFFSYNCLKAKNIAVIIEKVKNRGGERLIYFDNSATTSIHRLALDAYVKTSQTIMGNPSSLHRLGTQASRLLQEARKQIAALLNVHSEEIVFTSGGTEGNNYIIKGTAYEKQYFGKHILLSAIEHPSVSETCEQLAKQGFEISRIPVDKHGFVQLDELKKLIRKDTILVSIMAVNNEVGSIQPIQEISQLLAEYPKIHFHVDAVQAIGQIPTAEFLTERVDFATFSAHKFHGPRGVGFIYKKQGRKIQPLLAGGGQEQNQRSSTENLPAIVAMAKALRLLRDALSKYQEVVVFSGDENFTPHILCFALEGIRGEVLVHALEEKEIFISTTSACSSRKKMASSTLHAMNVEDKLAKCAVRISLDESNTMAEVEQFLIVFRQLYQKFTKVM